MKKLYLSLYLLIFITLIGLGWALDSVYQSVENDKQIVFPESLQIFSSYKAYLEKAPDRLNKSHPTLFKIEQSSGFLLPAPLDKDLQNGDIVILNSEEGVTFHQLLSEEKHMLTMGPILLDKPSLPWLKYALTALFYTGIAIIILFWLRPLLRDVGALSSSLTNISNGDLSARLNNKSLYLEELFNDFNQMAQKLEILDENNRLFSQAVSHDIRTPLSRILFALEDLEQHSAKDKEEVSSSIRIDVSKIESLTKELLHYSRLESVNLQSDSIDPKVLVEQVVAGFDHLQINIELTTNSLPSVITIDADLLQKILNNILSNATRYCNENIKIHIEVLNNNLKFYIEDDGQGIDLNAKTIDMLCQPFVQKVREDKHFGLGLAIVLRAIKLMSGQLKIDNNSTLGGARFSVIIPL